MGGVPAAVVAVGVVVVVVGVVVGVGRVVVAGVAVAVGVVVCTYWSFNFSTANLVACCCVSAGCCCVLQRWVLLRCERWADAWLLLVDPSPLGSKGHLCGLKGVLADYRRAKAP